MPAERVKRLRERNARSSGADSQGKKSLILEVAKERFSRFGVRKTTMDELAADAGISKKTLYECYRNKEDVFVALFAQEALALRGRVFRQIEKIDDPLDRLMGLLQAAFGELRGGSFMVEVLRDNDSLYAPFLKDEFRLRVEEGIIDLIRDLLNAGIKARRIRPIDPHTIAYFLFKLFQSLTYGRTASIRGNEKELMELIRLVLQGIARGQADRRR